MQVLAKHWRVEIIMATTPNQNELLSALCVYEMMVAYCLLPECDDLGTRLQVQIMFTSLHSSL